MMFALHMDTGENLGYVLLDTILEFIPVIAILFLSYLLMEWMEHRMGERAERAIAKAGPFAPAAGALLGCVPQCGFSAAAAGLYAGRVITLGTLYAVFFATSDEMLPIMLSAAFRGKFALWSILRVIGGKLVIGTLVGMLVDLVLRLFRLATKRWHHGEEPENGAPPCSSCEIPEPPECGAPKPPRPPKPPRRGLLPPRWEKFCTEKIGEFWNGDLLLLAVAILLLTGRGDDCEEQDDDLWLLLLLLYFMK